MGLLLGIQMKTLAVWLCLCIIAGESMGASIDAFGAVAGVNTEAAAVKNSAAIVSALQAADKAGKGGDHVVVVPQGSTYYIFNSSVAGLTDVTLEIEGTLILNNNRDVWKARTNATHVGALAFDGCANLTITGSGLIDGQGYDWWVDTILTGDDWRPNLVHVYTTEDLYITNVRVQNAPQYHWNVRYVKHARISGLNVWVDVDAQKEILRETGNLMKPEVFRDLARASGWDGVAPMEVPDIPIFPLNTDGIDIAGIDIVIENCVVENFDDVVAVKPSNHDSMFSDCTQDILVRNFTITHGVGLSIGSVPPNTGVNCIRNITLEDSTFSNPFKALYVKPNPGNVGSGIIDRITYRNIEIESALWYPLWFGPQQQHQPHQTGTGCSFFYPIDPECPPQPLVPMTNFVVENVIASETLLMPGVILCSSKNPCTGFQFTNVTITGPFDVQSDYVCHNADIVQTNVVPKINCAVVPDH